MKKAKEKNNYFNSELDILDNYQQKAMFAALNGNFDYLQQCYVKSLVAFKRFSKASKTNDTKYVLAMKQHFFELVKLFNDLIVGLIEYREKKIG